MNVVTNSRQLGSLQIGSVDIFCGAGGLTVGLEAAGIDVRLGVDADGACAYPYETNTSSKFMHCDIRDLKAETVDLALGDFDWKVLAGCAPCQPFSTYTQGKLDEDDTRWGLLATFSRLASDLRPDVVTMENVWKLQRHSVFDEFVENLQRDGYWVDWWILECVKYGIPQSRRRLVLIASRHAPPAKPLPTTPNSDDWLSVEDTIGHLKPISAGASDPHDPLHAASALSEINMKRMKASTPGGTWRDWPEDLRAACHTKATGKTYPSVYGRMEWEKPSPTITGQCYGFGNGRFGHPEQHRAISLREAALLQSFPGDFRFVESENAVSMKSVGQMIGNAVPPKLGEAVGHAIVDHISSLGGLGTVENTLQRSAEDKIS